MLPVQTNNAVFINASDGKIDGQAGIVNGENHPRFGHLSR
jgi:hypothetical protein